MSAEEFGIDVNRPIFGSQHPEELDRSIALNERIRFRFFIGERATTTAILVQEVDILEGHKHMERFTGVDVSKKSDGEEGLAPGSEITAVKDLRYQHVFIMQIGSEQVAVHEGYFNEDSPESTV